jgi:hypothetical protein
MNILTFTAAATLAVASQGIIVSQASARTDGHINGYTVEVVESGSWSAPDFITVYGPQGKEQITVTCAPFDWSSYGANTESFVNSIASSWCF